MTSVTPGEDALTAADVEAAAARLTGIAVRTPLQPCERLSQLTGWQVYLKREDLQPVRSYKLRGAYNLMAQLTAAERAAGVVCASAGNHAQGVAYASRRLGVRARIYVPRPTPRQKRDRDPGPRRRAGRADPVRYHLRRRGGRGGQRRGRVRGRARPAVRRPAHDGGPGHRRR